MVTIACVLEKFAVSYSFLELLVRDEVVVHSVYLALTGTHGAYGRLGVIVIALLWMYACMLLLLVGAYLSRWLVREGGRARRRGPLRRIFQKNG